MDKVALGQFFFLRVVFPLSAKLNQCSTLVRLSSALRNITAEKMRKQGPKFVPSVLKMSWLFTKNWNRGHTQTHYVVNSQAHPNCLLGTIQRPVKFSLEQATKPQRGSSYSSTLSLTSTLDGVKWSTPRPGRFTPREGHPVSILQEAGWPPGLVWTGARILDPTGIRSRYVHPVMSHYADWATPAPFKDQC